MKRPAAPGAPSGSSTPSRMSSAATARSTAGPRHRAWSGSARRARCARCARSIRQAHGAYTHASQNAIKIASDLIQDLYRLEDLPVARPEDIKRAIGASIPAIETALGRGAGDILNRFTISVGVIQGGIKINMLPGHCRLEVDIRLPVHDAWGRDGRD
jgi:acetylornithine deacetylase/succinyl-diaminopimelate desuccinylase-like protein